MKTSNYIIIAFFTFLFGGAFVLFVGAKLQKTRIGYADNWISEEKKLEPFSVVVAEPGADFNLRTAENPRILISFQKSDSCKFPPINIKNDTLFLKVDSSKNKHDVSCIIYTKDLNYIIAREGSYLKLDDFAADTLIIKITKAKLEMYFDKSKGQTALLSILADESEMNLSFANVKKMDVHINKSQLHAWNNSIESISGTLKNLSGMQATVLKKVNVESDSTCNFNIRK